MKFLIVGFPAFASFGPFILIMGVQSVGPIGLGFALVGGFMISAALHSVFSLLATQAKEIESLKEQIKQVNESS